MEVLVPHHLLQTLLEHSLNKMDITTIIIRIRILQAADQLTVSVVFLNYLSHF